MDDITDTTNTTTPSASRSRGNRSTTGRSSNRGGRTPRSTPRNRTKSTTTTTDDEPTTTTTKDELVTVPSSTMNDQDEGIDGSSQVPSSDLRDENEDNDMPLSSGNDNHHHHHQDNPTDDTELSMTTTATHATPLPIIINDNTTSTHHQYNEETNTNISDMGSTASTHLSSFTGVSTTLSSSSLVTVPVNLLMVQTTTESSSSGIPSHNEPSLPTDTLNTQAPISSTSTNTNSRGAKSTTKSTNKTTTTNSNANSSTTSKEKTRRRRKVEAKWVQCEKPECNKWRKLPVHMSLDDLPQGKWYCEFNYWDPERAFCDAPEESWDTNEITIDEPSSSSTTLTNASTVPSSDNKKHGRNKSSTVNDNMSNRSGATTPIPSDNEGGKAYNESGNSTMKPLSLPEIKIPEDQGNAFLNDDDDGPVYSTNRNSNKRRRDTAGDDDTQPTGGNTSSRAGGGGGGGKRRNRTNDTPGPVSTPTVIRKSTNPYVVTKPPLSSTGATLASMDRTNILPPMYVQGYRDYHNMMILHPIEVWADIGGGSGIFDQAIKGSWDQALSAGVHASYSSSSAPRVSWNELIAKSWNNPSGNRNTTVIPSTVVTESHFRWNKSSMYNRPSIGSMQAHEYPNETGTKINPNVSAQDIARSGGKASVNKLSTHDKPLIPLLPVHYEGGSHTDTQSPSRFPPTTHAVSSLSPIAQIALSLFTAARYENASTHAALPSKLLDRLKDNLRQTSYPTSGISTQPLRTSGPRETYYSAISHGIVMHTGIRVSPLDVIGASISESSRWSSASITLSQAITSMLTRSIQQHNKETKKQKRQELRRQQNALYTNGNMGNKNNNDDDIDDDDDDDDDFTLEYFGNHKINEPGYLYRLPYDMYIQQTYQERLIFSLVLYFILMVQLTENVMARYRTNNGNATMEGTYDYLQRMVTVYENIANETSTNTKNTEGCTETFLTTILQDTLYDYFNTVYRSHAVSSAGGIGPLAMKVRLKILVESGLVTKHSTVNDATTGNSKETVYYTVTTDTLRLLHQILQRNRVINGTKDNDLFDTVVIDLQKCFFYPDRTFHDILQWIDTLYMEKAIKDLSVTKSVGSIGSTVESSVNSGNTIIDPSSPDTVSSSSSSVYPNPLLFSLPLKIGKPWRGNE